MAQRSLASYVDRIASECVAVRLRMINRVVTNIYDDALRSLDLKVSQMNILVATAKMGTVRPTDLGEALHLDASTLSRNLERMKSRGWLETMADDQDGRSQPVRLTAQGMSLLQKATTAWEAAQTQVTRLLGKPVITQLHEATRRIHQSGSN